MRSLSRVIIGVMSVLFVISQSPARELRPINAPEGAPLTVIVPPGMDEGDTLLQYDNEEALEFFMSLPGSDYGDRYYNVRFTPPMWPFRIVAAHVPLFTFDSMGTPGMKVIVWQSGEVDDIPDMPAFPVDSLSVSFDDLQFGSDTLHIVNVVDLTPLEISFWGRVEFHIGVDIVTDSLAEDSLGIYMDDGRGEDSDRSIFWNNDEDCWTTLNTAYGAPHNFAIRVLIADEEGVTRWLEPSGLPELPILQPAWPNPFNSRTRLRFSVTIGAPYTLELLDATGRRVSVLASGIGRGDDIVTLSGAGLNSGAYFVRLAASGRASGRSLIYLR